MELMQRQIIVPQVPLGEDCAAIEEQLLQGAVLTGSAVASGSAKQRAETLRALVDSIIPPAMDDGGIFSGDVDEFSPAPESSPPCLGAVVTEEDDHAQKLAEMYWPDSQEPDDGTSSSASMHVDEQQHELGEEAGQQSGEDEEGEARKEARRARGTALEKRLTVEQYLYVVAAHCQVCHTLPRRTARVCL
jgi:hypothetical protein